MALTIREAWQTHRGRGMVKLTPYLDAQQRHFARYQGRAPAVLEIGVKFGGSLELWHRYFGEGTRVVGIDIDPSCQELADDATTILIGDQADPDFLATAARHGPFDVVIDDGGHQMQQQIIAFEELWPHVKDGGVYCCEDTLTSYLPHYGAGRGQPGTFMERMKTMVDELNSWFEPQSGTTDFARTAVSMHFYPSLVVIEKGEVERPQMIAARDDAVIYGTIDGIIRPRSHEGGASAKD